MPQDKANKTGMRNRLFYALLTIGMIAFGLTSFFLGWSIYYNLNPLIGCSIDPMGGCIVTHIPLYIVGLTTMAEGAASAFVGLTLYKMIHQRDTIIQELEAKLGNSEMVE